MSLIDREFLNKFCPTAVIKDMPTPMRVRGIGSKFHDASSFAEVDFYFPTLNSCIAHFRREIHLVNKLDANALIGIDILKPERWILDLPNGQAVLTANLGLKVTLSVETRGLKVKQTVYTKSSIAIPPKSRRMIPIKGLDRLPNRDMLFEPSNEAVTLFSHIMDKDTNYIMAENDTALPIIVSEGTKLGYIGDIKVENYFAAPAENSILAAHGTKPNWARVIMKGLLATAAVLHTAPLTPHVDTQITALETRLPNGVTVYGTPVIVDKFASVVNKFAPLWEDNGQQVKVPAHEHMEIPLIDNWETHYKAGQARVYPLGHKEQKVVNETFNKLHEQGRLEWTTAHTPFSFPCFVV